MPHSRPRVFIGLTEVAGYFGSLYRGFQANGVPCTFVDVSPDPFRYGSSNPSLPVRLHRLGQAQRSKGGIRRLLGLTFIGLSRFALFAANVLRHDVFIFSAARSFLGYLDLPILKALGKRIVFVFLGTEVRPAYVSGNLIIKHVLGNGTIKNIDYLVADAAEKKKRLRTIEKHADIIVSHPPMAVMQSKPFVSHLILGFPVQPPPVGPQPQRLGTSESVRILHAPSFPQAKGTAVIEEMVDKVRARGHIVEFEKITNVPNEEVLKRLTSCDFVIDELYSDTPMGGFGTEAAFFGKPCVTGGYYAEAISRDYAPEHIPPSLYCLPQEVEATIEILVADPQYRSELGESARSFVRSKWSAREVALRYLRLLRREIPEEWLFDPSRLPTICGYGLPREKLRDVLRAMLDKFPASALQLSDKPTVQAAFLDFAS